MQELEYPEEDAARKKAEEHAIAVKVLRLRYELAVREFNAAKIRVDSLKDSLTALGAAP
jgi:uncharacterized protein HemY